MLQDVQNKPITDHKKLQEGVFQTTYEGGKTVIVNYNAADVEVDGKTIKAKDFFVGGES